MEKLIQQNLYHIIQEFSKFGSRWLESEGEENTRQIILDVFENLTMDNVYCEWFQCHNYIPKEYYLRVLSPSRYEIRCEPLEYSKYSEVEGELVFLGEFKEEDVNTISKLETNLEGKICLIVSDTPAFFISELADKGAVGVIVATEAPDNLIRRLAAKSYPPNFDDPTRWKAEIPGVSISKQDLYRLLSLMSSGKVTVKIGHFWESKISRTCNIVGVVEGCVDESIVVGAHYDSQMKTVGVWDNLTGLSTLLELARVFSKVKNRKRMIFIAFAAEEIGLWGSAFFVKKNRRELREECNAMFCLDAISSAYPTERSLWVEGFLKDFIIESVERYGSKIDNIRGLNVSYSDYYPFVLENISAAMIWEYPPINPYYHTEKDLLRYISLDKLYFMGELYRKIVEDLDRRNSSIIRR